MKGPGMVIAIGEKPAPLRSKPLFGDKMGGSEKEGMAESPEEGDDLEVEAMQNFIDAVSDGDAKVALEAWRTLQETARGGGFDDEE